MLEGNTIAAIILAGGKGTRFREVTKSDSQKVLYPVAGKPLVEYTTDLLDPDIIQHVVFNVGYRAQDVSAWVFNQHFGFHRVSISLQQRWTFLDAAIRAFAATREDIIVICNADEVRDGLILADAIEFHLRKGRMSTIIGVKKSHLIRYRLLHIGEDDVLTSSEYSPQQFADKPEEAGIVNAGIAILNRDSFQYFDENDPTGGWNAMLHPLTERAQISVYVDPKVNYFNVGTPEELTDVTAYFGRKG